MTRRRSAEPLTKVTLNLHTQDVDRLKDIYADVGYTVAIKAIVRKHLLDLDKKQAEILNIVDEIDV